MAVDIDDQRRPVMSTQVRIAMLTYQRLSDLELAIPAVLAQVADVSPSASLMVVDNDPAGSARSLVASFAEMGVLYVHEPRPGIAAARNRAIRECSRDDILVFIDDDERPHEKWLARLCQAQIDHGATAVVGPVISEFSVAPDVWIQAGRFFERRRLHTGTKLKVAATNNLLLDLDRIHSLGLLFDERFGQSGGSDTLFTRRLALAGELMIWCDEAIVSDMVPVARLTRTWVLTRALRSGNSWTRTSLELARNPFQSLSIRMDATARGSVRIVAGGVRVMFGTVARRTDHQARGLRTVARGLGMLTGAFGYTYHEYRRKTRSLVS